MSVVNIKTLKINNLDFTVREAGKQNDGDLVILLHGFPESSLMWEHTLSELADKGYYAVAFDQRGYSLGAIPNGISEYSMEKLASDVTELAKILGYQNFHLVGHDIGAVVGWTVVAKHPKQVKSWTALSVPNWPAYRWSLENDPAQKGKGAYVHRFQEPDKPEQVVAANDFEVLRTLWNGFNDDIVKKYIKMFSQPGVLTGVINWYRALFQTKNNIEYDGIETNTELIWGNQDLVISRASVERNEQYMSGQYRFVEIDAGHWLTEFNTEEIERLIIDHIG